MRTVIIGGPGAGKTTLARAMGGIVRHTDDVIELGWSEASSEVATWFDDDYDVIEGVAVVRALRKWLRANPEGAPCDVVIYLTSPHVALNNRQMSMVAGVWTMFDEIHAELEARGVDIEHR